MATRNEIISLRPGEGYVEAGTRIHTEIEGYLRDGQIRDDIRMGESPRDYAIEHFQVSLTFDGPEYTPEHTCPRCMQEIDPDVCGCGDYIEGHGSPMETGHSPVPMGCDCGRGGNASYLPTESCDPVEQARTPIKTPWESVSGTLAKVSCELGESAVALAEGIGISAPKAAQPVYTDAGEDFELTDAELREWRDKNG
jgi:hypothetical protein